MCNRHDRNILELDVLFNQNLKQHTLYVNIIIIWRYLSFVRCFFNVKLPIFVKLITEDKPMHSYVVHSSGLSPFYVIFRTLHNV